MDNKLNVNDYTSSKVWSTGTVVNKEMLKIPVPAKVKLNIGCGNERKEGFRGVDLIAGPNVDIVASAWKLPFKDDEVDEIVSEHMIEHLTFYQFNRTIDEWYRVLKPDGTLTIECPDLKELCKEFAGSNEYRRYYTTGHYHPLIHQLYGHQRGSNINEQMSQVHKSGYTLEHLDFVLKSVGFEGITVLEPMKAPPNTPVLRVTCRKAKLINLEYQTK